MATATRNATKYTFTVLVTAVVTYIITVSFTGQRLLVKRKISIDISTSGNFERQQNETSTKLDGHENQNILRQIEAVKSVCVHKEDPPTIPHSNSPVAQNVPIRGSVKRRVFTQRANRTPTQEILSRRRRVEKVCQTTWVRGEVHGVFTHRSGVIYCYVPKAGCTFWKRVFTAAGFGNGQDPFSISRNIVHSQFGKGENYSSAHNETAYPTRLLVVRDPFSRLLASYLDKVYLPDFWSFEAKEIQRGRRECSSDFLRKHFEQMASKFQRTGQSYSTCSERMCAKYLTFAEFVEGSFQRQEPHWTPIHQICNPCAFKATHIVHLESFSQDVKPILAKMEMGHILNGMDQNKQVELEMDTLINYHFERIKEIEVYMFYRSCITLRELAYRLWQTFQWKGYIDPEMTYIVPDDTLAESAIKNNLIAQVRRARESGLGKAELMVSARERFQAQVYQTLPKYLFENLMIKYKTDFQLFGYEDMRDSMYSFLYNSDLTQTYTNLNSNQTHT
ncbi:carbohydrate sulfotransferase 10-like [Biomphalaria glabrata]|uniref:Carbohydrate sulfotransferase n=1 Tax=Biomphalaria glabrata TaxID=6526 RepID=A0A9W3BPT5_BIOGL|nr:carbohydrate sulfotransferase 10-like [Biomphalaria glabrata]